MATASKKSTRKTSRDSSNLHKVSKKSSFKTKRKSDDDVQSKSLAMQLEDDAPDFPRGGRSSLSRREEREIRAEVDAEFEAKERLPTKNKKKKAQKKKALATADDDLGSLFGDGLTSTLPRFANKITLKNISAGMKLLGVIAEVDEKDLVVSLPGGLRGLVRASDAFDPLGNEANVDNEGRLTSGKFHIGQLVSCVVLRLDGDKKGKGTQKIWLSLRLSLLYKDLTFDALHEGMVLSAYVKSIEDHGYILHFGLPRFTGFCPKSSSQGNRDVKVRAGQLLQGFIRSIDTDLKVVYLSSDPDMVSKSVTKELKGISIGLLVPGMMVNACIRSTLENGIMLSFLTYFTGTVDLFHLQNAFPTANWRDGYPQNKKVNARILFIDPSTRAIGLTLNHQLIQNNAPPSLIKHGDVFEHSRVVRVDRELGILLEIPTVPLATPAYVLKSDTADKEDEKSIKKFKEGSVVRVRIIGIRHLEGLAMGTLKASAFEGSLFIHSDVKPGMVVKAKVILVDAEKFGALVQFPSGVKALCPCSHMSEFEIAKPGKKFKVGAELVFRVLGCKSKRITVTHKKSLVKSKLEIITSYTDASEGLVTHGWISKIETHGCFVRFYNGVQGFAPRSELGLEPGSDISSVFHVGQVVKCRVTSSLSASRRINLSFMIKPSRMFEDNVVQLGSIVSGVVERVIPDAVIVIVEGKNYLKGTISTEQLSDHDGHAALMKSSLKPGYKLEELLVLDIEGNTLILSAKFSLIKTAQQLPVELSQIQPHSVVHGYICNLIDRGCFVRFLGRLTGFCSRNKAMDDQGTYFPEAFYIGQSVRSYILNVDVQTSRITLSLKQSYCSSTDGSFIQEYFLTEEKIAEQQFSSAGLEWVGEFNVGSVVQGKVHEVQEFGVVIHFEKYRDLTGFITHYQLGGTVLEVGSTVRAAVLDIAKCDCLVELSLKAEFVGKLNEDASRNKIEKKKRKRDVKDLKVQRTVNVIVEIVKESYLVLSLPEYNFTIGYASINDYNTQRFSPQLFQTGQCIVATVTALPSPSTAGRLLLLLKSTSLGTNTSNSKRARMKSSYDVGSLVQAEIAEIKPLELRLKFGIGFRGRVHVTEASDDNAVADPWSNYRIGQVVTARILSKAKHKSRADLQWDLSIKPSILACSSDKSISLVNEAFSFSRGQFVSGYVYKVEKEWAWLTVSRHVKAQLFYLDSAFEPSELQQFRKRFAVGRIVSGYVSSINNDKKVLRLVLHPFSSASSEKVAGEVHQTSDSSEDSCREKVITHIRKQDVVGGKISKVLPGVSGLLVQIGPHLYGKVHFTELTDSWISNPLSGYHEGQLVKCKVLEINTTEKGTIHIDLSLRVSLIQPHCAKAAEVGSIVNTPPPSYRAENVADLHPDMVVQGYIKSVTPKGCFIMLSRNLDAKILISNLSEKYVENPEVEFPIGMLVTGKILSVEPLSKRVEVTLKASNTNTALKSENHDLSSLRAGDIISGIVRRVESFGLFITINNTNLVGLCHVSELSDTRVDNIESKYRAGERVTAKILKVDDERHRISLGMKNSYFVNDTSDEDHDMLEVGSPKAETVDAEGENIEGLVLAEAESRASIRPLEVSLEDMNHFEANHLYSETEKYVTPADGSDGKDLKGRRKAKSEREKGIRAAEERLLEQHMPKTVDEYEKLVRSSPDNSFVWIKYISFVVSLADIEKGRSIAERALRTINIREETEKFNVWVAYLNLENVHGNPREEAVKKVFHRALQFCDPEKIHLSLLEIYEKTGQDILASELLEKMTKKFRRSCTVWLKSIEWNLKQHLDGVQLIVKRALLSLPKHEHVNFIKQTAILEFNCGVPERGRSMFESILREYPKRTDIWNIYLDQEIRQGDADTVHALFERAISLSVSSKKIKPLFEKYLKYEKATGDEERVEYVKKRAMDYVNSLC